MPQWFSLASLAAESFASGVLLWFGQASTSATLAEHTMSIAVGLTPVAIQVGQHTLLTTNASLDAMIVSEAKRLGRESSARLALIGVTCGIEAVRGLLFGNT